MESLYQKIKTWLEHGETAALATVVQTWGSSPRPIGSQMAISSNDELVGSVSGGCVENDVIVSALEVMRTSHSKLLKYSVSSENALAVGLSCGGEMEVFLQPFQNAGVQHDLLECVLAKKSAYYLLPLQNNQPFSGDILLFETDKPPDSHLQNNFELYPSPASELRKLPIEIQNKLQLQSNTAHLQTGRLSEDYFLLRLQPPQQIIIVGAGHIAVKLAELAAVLAFDCIVIDPRAAFITEERFPKAEIHHKWPDKILPKLSLNQNTALVTLSHDPKIDDPAINWALTSGINYIGALGSRSTHAKRIERLQEKGFSPEQINRLHAPVGLDIAARTASEIALSILAQIVQESHTA
ncbi:MAG: XdhC family protein [Deferribacteres bacterium]|nr:XdhC family protein [Deferribacteres bacterium]